MIKEIVPITKAIIDKNHLEIENPEILLNRLNIFVGENNSGKSRIVRAIIDNKKTEYELHNEEYISKKKIIIEVLNKIKNESKEVLRRINYNELIGIIEFLENNTGSNDSQRIESVLNRIENNYIRTIQEVNYPPRQSEVAIVRECTKSLQKIAKSKDTSPSRLSYYIPTLRGLRKLQFFDSAELKLKETFTDAKLDRNISFNMDFYKGRTLKDYWPNNNIVSGNDFNYSQYEEKIGINIFTGIDLYKELSTMMLGSYSERVTIQEWCSYLKDYYFKEEIDITPNLLDNVVKIKLGSRDERSIHDLGDGLQSIIIITFVMFKCKDRNSIIAIEEPELFLHPGMQRILVHNMLDEQFKKIQFLLTTHSNHFLDVLYENKELVKIYSCQRKSDILTLDNLISKNERLLLSNLGVKPSSLFLSNAIIMVEGLSDIHYYRKFLNLYMEQNIEKCFIEDRDYTFIESSGNNIIHWDFLEGEITSERLFKSLFIIVDGDDILNSDSPFTDSISLKKERLEKIKSLEYSHVLESREVENLLPWSVVKKYIIQKESNYNGISRDIDDNSIRDYLEEEYKNRPLGSFIEDSLSTLQKSLGSEKTHKYDSVSGSIRNKIDFSNETCNLITDFDILTKEAKLIAEKLYNFILEVNNL